MGPGRRMQGCAESLMSRMVDSIPSSPVHNDWNLPAEGACDIFGARRAYIHERVRAGRCQRDSAGLYNFEEIGMARHAKPCGRQAGSREIWHILMFF